MLFAWPKGVNTFPMLLVGTKSDLVDHRQVSTSEGQELASNWSTSFFETSSLLNTNVEPAFVKLLQDMRGTRPRHVTAAQQDGAGRFETIQSYSLV